MPGNEVADKVHNFFEQDYLSQVQHQLQFTSGNRVVLNNNPWAGSQRQIRTPLSSNPKNYSVQQLDSGNENGRQSSRVPPGMNVAQLTLRPEFTKSQSGNQQPRLNGFMHGHQGFQRTQNQAEFLGEDTISDRYSLVSRGVSVLGPQQGNGSEQSLCLTKNLERLETAETPINFDYLGDQQQLMRGQQSGMPQPWARQQSGFNDLPPWQQQLIIKQLQEARRQQQLQQLDEARQQNSLNQPTAIARQTAGDQLPAVVNGTPGHDASNYLWPNEHMGGDSKVVPSTSQMFMVGSMSRMQRSGSPSVQGFPNGLMVSHEQGQVLRSMALVPQQLDQSLYGAPIASSRGNLSQYSNIQGFSHDSADMLTKAGGNQVEKPLIQSSSFNNSFQGSQGAVFQDQVCMQEGASVSRQGLQGNSLFGHVPVQGLSSGVVSGNYQQLNSMPRNVPVQEFHGMQERAGWSRNFQEKAMTHVGPSQSLVTLDPTEERILFNTDDSTWDAPLDRSSNMGTGGYGNTLEGTDYFNVFPSIQSGSWSALMQSAVAEASSSDTGLQEEWSGLSLQKTEPSTGNQPTAFNDSGKGQTSWFDSNLHSAASLTSKPFPLFDDANMSPSSRNIPGFQQSSIKFSHEHSETVRPDSSHDSIQQSPKEGGKWLDRSPQQKPLVEGSHQVQPSMHLDNALESAWAGQFYERSETAARSADVEVNAQNIQGSWAHQHSISSYNIGSHPCNKPNGWNINEALSPTGDATVKTCENENSAQSSQGNDHKKAMHAEMDHNGGKWKADGNCMSFGGLEQIKSGIGSPQVNTEDSHVNNFTPIPNSGNAKINQEINQQVPLSHQFDYGKQVLDSSMKYKGNESGGKYQHQLGKVPRVSESSLNNSDRASGGTYDMNHENCYQKEICNDSYNSSQSHHTVTGGGVRDNAWLSADDSHSLAGGNQKSSGQVGRKAPGSRRFHYHPMGSLGVNMEPAETIKHVTNSQVLSQQFTRVSKDQEKAYSKFVGHVPNNAMAMEKGQFADFQGNMKNSEEPPSRGVLPGYGSSIPASFDRSAGFYAGNRTAQTSQNILELLHKVDKSREHSSVKHFDSSDRNTSFEMPEAEASDTSVSHLQRTQSSTSQGFGLRLAPPSQRLPVSSHAFSSQRSSQNVNDVNSRHTDPEVGEKGQTWLARTASVQSVPPSHETSQREHWDNKSSILGQAGNETSFSNMQENSSTAFTSVPPYSRNQLQNQQMAGTSGQVVQDQSVSVSFDRVASHFTQTNNSHDRAVSDQSAHASLLGVGSRILPFNLGPTADSSQPINTNSYLRVSGQQLPVMEAVSVSQPSVASGMSQQGAFSTMLHNVWNNVSTQQHISDGQPHKVPPSLFQSVNPSNNNLETTSWASQKPGDQHIKEGGNGSSEFGTHSTDSQRLAHWEDQPRKENSWQQIPFEKVELAPQTAAASQGQECVAKKILDANSVACGTLLAHPHQQESDRGRNGKDPALVSETEHVSLQNRASSNRDIEPFGRSLKQSHVLQQKYSLLHQLQAMKGVETDPSKVGVKRLKGADCGPDAPQAASNAGQKLLHGYSPMVRDAVDNELNVAAHRSSFPSGDSKMLSFSSVAKEDQNASASSVRAPSPDMVTFGRNDSQNRSDHVSIGPARSEHSQISPQMAPSWFEQYGTFKNGQMLPMYDTRRTAKTVAQQYFLGKPSESLPRHTTEQVDAVEAGQVGSAWQSPTTSVVASEHLSPPFMPPDVSDQSLAVVRPKKRKSATSELLPWHKEVTQGSQRLQNISVAELDWAQAANRLIEKVEDDAEMIEDVQPMVRPRRRLILTTQLMQQLLRPAPPSILSAEATSNYENVLYFVAKLALGDACSLISCSGSDSRAPPDNGSTTLEKVKFSKIISDQYFSKVVEDFIGRARKLENDLLRLDKRASILDIRVDCQDLERFSVINRFAKFHGRGHADGAETSSSSNAGAISQKTCPQRYVTALPMPRNLPEGIQCLSL